MASITLQDIATVVGILTAVCSGIYILYKDYKKVERKFREKLKGKWTNEGDFARIGKESHYCDLELSTDVDDGEILGVIDCRNLKDGFELNNVSINGNLKFKSAILTLSDVKHGKHLKYAKVKISFDGKIIKWNLKSGDENYFPKSTIFWNID